MSNFSPELLTAIAKRQYHKVWSALRDYDDHEDPNSNWAHLPEIFLVSVATKDKPNILKIIKCLHKKIYFDQISWLSTSLERAEWDKEIKVAYNARFKQVMQELNSDIYHEVILGGRAERIIEYLEQGASINCYNNGGTTLAMAALSHSCEIFETLLNYSNSQKDKLDKSKILNINAKDNEGTYLINYAAHAYLKYKASNLSGPTGLLILLNHYKNNVEQLQLFESQLRPYVREKAQVSQLFKTYIDKALLENDLSNNTTSSSMDKNKTKHFSVHKI